MTATDYFQDQVRRAGVAMNYRSMGRQLLLEAKTAFREGFEREGARATVEAMRAFHAADAEMKNWRPEGLP